MTSAKPGKLRVALLIALMVFAAALVIVVAVLIFRDTTQVTPLDHWTIETKNGVMENVSTADASFGNVSVGDVISLQGTIPAEAVNCACLQVMTTRAFLHVYLEDTLIYEHGEEHAEAGELVPSEFHFVPLPGDYAGKPLKLELVASENGAFSGMNPVYFGSINAIYISYLFHTRISVLASLFLIVTGLVMLFIFFFLWNYYQREMRIFFSGLIALCLGIYVLNFNEVTDFAFSNPVANDFWECLTLYLLTPLFISFLGSIQERGERGIYTAMSAFDIGLIAYIVILHIAGIVFINRFVTISHIMLLSQAVVLIVLTIRKNIRFRRQRRAGEKAAVWRISDRILLICFFTMMLFGVIDVVRYIIMRYFGAVGATYATLNFVIVGGMVFVVGLFLNFFYYHIERVNDDEMVKHLSGLAYTDPLTGMANRSRCEKLLEEIDVRDTPCTVLSMDVDYLKRVNDTYGHATGDQYLVDIATMLRASFPDARLLGRMGGDEFIVIMDGLSPEVLDACVKTLNASVAKANETSEKIAYGISYGHAFSDEPGVDTIQTALSKADARMYDMKQRRHAAEGRA